MVLLCIYAVYKDVVYHKLVTKVNSSKVSSIRDIFSKTQYNSEKHNFEEKIEDVGRYLILVD